MSVTLTATAGGTHVEVDCTDCHQTDLDCTTCYGCLLCDSEGYTACPACDGSGYVDNDSDRYCPACKGRTNVHCPRGCEQAY